MEINFEEILDIGSQLVQEAGALTLPYFERYVKRYNKDGTHSQSKVIMKDDHSPVTEADMNTEQWLRQKLMDVFPDFGLIGEEFGDDKKESDYSWVIDPIDGTRSFITGVPLYTTLLGLVDSHTHIPLAGFIYAPVTQELIYAAIGMGAWYNGIRTRVEHIDDISDATVVSYNWQAVRRKSARLLDMNDRAETVRTWGDGFGYMLLATGRVHAVIDPKMHMWDLMPVTPIITEAGGVVGSWDGKDIDWFSNDIDCIATISQSMLDYIQKNT